MAGLDPAVHVFGTLRRSRPTSWIPGSRPGMTVYRVGGFGRNGGAGDAPYQERSARRVGVFLSR